MTLALHAPPRPRIFATFQATQDVCTYARNHAGQAARHTTCIDVTSEAIEAVNDQLATASDGSDPNVECFAALTK